MKKEPTENDKIMLQDAISLASHYSLDGLGKQLSHRTLHSIISIRNNKSISLKPLLYYNKH